MDVPAWLGLMDFNVLLLEKLGGAPRTTFTETRDYRWCRQR